MLALIDGGPAALERARAVAAKPKVVHDLAAVTLLAPLPVPRRIRDFLCFELHVRQSRANRYLFGMGTERLDPAKSRSPRSGTSARSTTSATASASSATAPKSTGRRTRG